MRLSPQIHSIVLMSLTIQRVYCNYLWRSLIRRDSAWGILMFYSCANLACSAPFEYRRGRIFRFRQSHPKGQEPKNSHAVRHFWLCAKCSETYFLEYHEGRVAVVPRQLIVFSG